MSDYKFQRGEEVIYVPPHADGPEDDAATRGTVKYVGVITENNGPGYYLDLGDGSGVAKLCYERDLEPIDE